MAQECLQLSWRFKTPFEVSRIVGAAGTIADLFICIQSDSHQKSDGNYFGVCGLLKIDGGGKTLTNVVQVARYGFIVRQEQLMPIELNRFSG